MLSNWLRNIRIWFNAAGIALFDVALVFLSILLFVFALFSVEQGEGWKELPAWSFLALTLFLITLKDTMVIFSRPPEFYSRLMLRGGTAESTEQVTVTQQMERDRAKLLTNATVCIFGITSASVQLTLSILRMTGIELQLAAWFDYSVVFNVVLAALCTFIIKVIGYSREQGYFA